MNFYVEKNIRTGTSYYCHNCGQNYYLIYNIHRHIKLECGVPKKFSCPECSKGFARNNHLKRHLMFVHNVYCIPST